jgi:ubiquinone/menaquinone biosynthesis C-methylase UbiE
MQGDTEYWDSVAGVVRNRGPGIAVTWNREKVGILFKELMGYDFSNTRILEVGCGGSIVGYMMRMTTRIDYTPTDFSPEFCKIAKSVLGKEVTQARITSLPFPDAGFDGVFIFDVLEHIDPLEREKAYSELDRVLKKPGKLFINNPVRRSLHDPNFDYGFGMQDIANLAIHLDMEITYLKAYVSNGNTSQFIVMDRM